MKLPIASSILLSLVASGNAAAQASSHGTVVDKDAAAVVFQPHRVDLSDLLEDSHDSDLSDSFLKALTDVGIVAVKNIPGYSDHKDRALSSLHGCAIDSSSGSQRLTLGDGTARLTLASQTVPGPGGQQKIFKTNDPQVEEEGPCREFVRASDSLRSTVDGVTRAFAHKLGAILDTSKISDHKTPLLSTEDGSYDFSSFGDVVENGDHLEHFHSYHRSSGSGSSTKSDKNNVRHGEEGSTGSTIDLHTDQGLFIAFTPGMIVSAAGKQGDGDDDAHSAATSISSTGGGGFYIEQKDGTLTQVEFHPDDLVFMLGDGVNQYINPRIVAGSGDGGGRRALLRATPHALTMPRHSDNEVRVWHGRMVLPPSGAVHPGHGKTFGQLRKLMIEASLSGSSPSDSVSDPTGTMQSLSIGCSSPDETARLLSEEDVTCETGSTYCWHRCMPHEEQSISVELCASRNLQLKCINPRGQVYLEGHGDYYPACTNNTEPATDYPALPDYPRDPEVCDEESWEAFANSDGYDHVFDKLGDNRGNRGFWDGANEKGEGKVAKFMWNVVDDSMIEGKVVFNGLFGYLALGLAKDEGNHNGMNGASIIMAIPGGDYSAKFGLDLGMDDTVNEYIIDPVGSAFRHWSDPLEGRDTSSYAVTPTDCFTALTFKTDNINDIPFNISGTDALVWAGNLKDSFCGSHGRGQEGRGDRDHFAVEWKTGKGWFPAEMEEEEEDGEKEEPKTMTASETTSAADTAQHTLAGLALVVTAAGFVVM